MPNTRSLVAKAPGAKFEKAEMPLRALHENAVAIKILYSGICHSDIHQARDEWFEGIFPMVPGHEIVGEVTEVGSKVSKFKVGDRVGVGTFVDSCRECEYCQKGMENYCLRGNVQTYNGRHYDGEPTYGGYAQDIVVDQNYVVTVPKSLDPAAAAPLLCAGITLYSPLKHWRVGPGMRVAILGLGGLGHMGVKFAKAMGAEVYVLGHSAAKKADAIRFGAKDYLITTDSFESHRNFFDVIVNTISADLDVDALLGMLKVGGSLVNVGLPGNHQSYNPFSIIGGLKSIAGANTGNIKDTQEMLDFCGEHNIVSDVEIVNASDAQAVDDAYQRVVASDVRYRFVIDASTI
ncbi:MAG: NAD(P)-dependent alcohol dehydrogenase [Actinobacteria bacterium]|nr:NAD(P)-dependent alcohol dehydrogenase [Actinomycetota bacterium]